MRGTALAWIVFWFGLLGLALAGFEESKQHQRFPYDTELAIDRAKAGAQVVRYDRISDTETLRYLRIPSDTAPGSTSFDHRCWVYFNEATGQAAMVCDE